MARSAGTWGRDEWGRGAGPAGGGRGRVSVSGTRSPLPAPGVGSCVGLSSSLSRPCRGDHRSRTGTPPSLALGTRVSTSLFPSRGGRAEHCGSTPVFLSAFLQAPLALPRSVPPRKLRRPRKGHDVRGARGMFSGRRARRPCSGHRLGGLRKVDAMARETQPKRRREMGPGP